MWRRCWATTAHRTLPVCGWPALCMPWTTARRSNLLSALCSRCGGACTGCLSVSGYLVRLTNGSRFEWHRQNSSNTLLTKTNKVSFSSLEYRLCMVNFWASNVCFQRIHRACQGGATDLPKSLNRHISKHGPDTDTLPCSEM